MYITARTCYWRRWILKDTLLVKSSVDQEKKLAKFQTYRVLTVRCHLYVCVQGAHIITGILLIAHWMVCHFVFVFQIRFRKKSKVLNFINFFLFWFFLICYFFCIIIVSSIRGVREKSGMRYVYINMCVRKKGTKIIVKGPGGRQMDIL